MIRVLLIWLMLAGAALADPPRIVMLGDSLTAGFGLKRGEGLVPVLSRWLEARGTPARLADHGLSGDTTFGGRTRIGWALRGGADAVVVELGANDMLMGLPVAAIEANLDAILTRAGAGGRPVLLVGIGAIPSREADWRRDWAAMWPRLADRHRALLLPDLYAPLAAIPRADRPDYLLADRMHPSAKGVKAIVDHLGPKVQALIARTQAR